MKATMLSYSSSVEQGDHVPAPTKTGRGEIIAVGRELVEEGGLDALTMHAVALRIGVRPPSLYKHVRDRRDLLAEVVAATVMDVAERMEAAQAVADPRRSIVMQISELRRFALARPHDYFLVFGSSPGVPRPMSDALERALRPLLDAMTALLGPDHALDGARFMTAWANGFLTMELTGALQLGGDIAAAWEWGLQRAVAALTAGAPDRS